MSRSVKAVLALLLLCCTNLALSQVTEKIGYACQATQLGARWWKKGRNKSPDFYPKKMPTVNECKSYCATKPNCIGFNFNKDKNKRSKGCYFQEGTCSFVVNEKVNSYIFAPPDPTDAPTPAPTTSPTASGTATPTTGSPSTPPTPPTNAPTGQPTTISRAPGLEDAPHILFIVADDMGFNDLKRHQDENDAEGKQLHLISTPELDKLFDEGVELHQYYTQSVCSPTRASIMTGRYPSHTGVGPKVITPCANYAVPASERFLPLAMKMNGYETSMVGKWHLGQLAPRHTPIGRGFDFHMGLMLGEQDYFTHFRWLKTKTLWNGAPDYVVAHDFWRHRTTFWDDLGDDILKYNNKVDPAAFQAYVEDGGFEDFGYPGTFDNEPEMPDTAAYLLDDTDGEFCAADASGSLAYNGHASSAASSDGHLLESEDDKCMNEHYATFAFAREFENSVVKPHVDTRPMFMYVPFTAPHEGQGIVAGIGGNAGTVQNELEYINQTPKGMWNGVNYGSDNNADFFEEGAAHANLNGDWSRCTSVTSLEHKSRCEYAVMIFALDQAIGMMRKTLETHCADPVTLETIAYSDGGACAKSYWDDTVVIFNSDNGGYNQQGKSAGVTNDGSASKNLARRNGNNYPLLGYKTTVWEGGIRTPCMIKGTTDKGTTRGRIHDSWVKEKYEGVFHAVDWYKTVVDMIELPGSIGAGGTDDNYFEKTSKPLDSKSHWGVLQNSKDAYEADGVRVRDKLIHQATKVTDGCQTTGAIRMTYEGKDYKLLMANDKLRIKTANQELVLPDATNKEVPVGSNGRSANYKFACTDGSGKTKKSASQNVWLFDMDVTADNTIYDLERVNLLKKGSKSSSAAKAAGQALFDALAAYSLEDSTVGDMGSNPKFGFTDKCVHQLEGVNGSKVTQDIAGFLKSYNGNMKMLAWGPQCGVGRGECDSSLEILKLDKEEVVLQSGPHSDSFTTEVDEPLTSAAVTGIVFASIAGVAFVGIVAAILFFKKKPANKAMAVP